MHNYILLPVIFQLLFSFDCIAGDSLMVKHPGVDSAGANSHRMNIFIISKPRKFDPGMYFQIIRTGIRNMTRRKKFRAIVAGSSQQMAEKVIRKLKKHNAAINHLWFDSHGYYAKGYSSFSIGTDEYSYHNIRDSLYTQHLGKLAPFCDSATRIGIGSCYGGATFARPSLKSSDTVLMYGDSLMKGLAEIFGQSTVFGSESWVMTKPGLFKERFAMAGSPIPRRFRDVVFKPVWERLGKWNSYNPVTRMFKTVNCVMLDQDGNIGVRFNSYQSLKKVKRKIAKNVNQLKPNRLKV